MQAFRRPRYVLLPHNNQKIPKNANLHTLHLSGIIACLIILFNYDNASNIAICYLFLPMLYFRRNKEKKEVYAMQNEKRPLDMLHGPIWNKLPRFALPVAATAILEQLFNASDIAVVGNFTGAEKTAAVAAVGANSPVIGLIVNLFIGIALGANVVIAHAIGQKDNESVHKAVHTAVLVALLGGVAVAILGELAAAPLLGLLNVPDEVFPLALLYLRIYLLGMPVILLYNFEAAIFRSIGETKTPLLALTASGILNVALNLFFVAVLHMTVNGVAIATVLSNAVSAIILYRKLRRSTLEIRLDPRALRVDRASLKQILRIGLPAGVQSAVFALSNIIVQSAINSLGTIVMAASSAAFNIEVFTYDILNSFSQACTTFVGQNYGAGDVKRCRKTLALCLIEGAACAGRGHHADSLLRQKPAGHLQQRSGSRLHRHDPAGHDHARALVQPAIRGHVRLSARVRHFARPRAADDAGRVRRAHQLDSAGLPAQPHLPHDHDGVPHQPFDDGADDLHRARMLSPQPEKGRLRAGKERLTARLSSFSAQTASATFHRRHTPSPTRHDARRDKSSDEPSRRFSALRAPF